MRLHKLSVNQCNFVITELIVGSAVFSYAFPHFTAHGTALATFANIFWAWSGKFVA